MAIGSSQLKQKEYLWIWLSAVPATRELPWLSEWTRQR
jgi:hypothetical protein